MNWSSESIPNVIQASKDILGDDNIYYMIAYKPLQKSSAFRLWCKAKGMSISEYNEVAKDLDNYLNDIQWKDLIEESKVFRGVIESVAPSPCSFLLLDKPISEEIGLIRVGNQICCTLDGYNCDVYKYLKNDLLSVSVYSLISKTYELIGRPIDTIEFITSNCDDNVWNLFEKGLTATLNQTDSDFAKNLIMEYKPKRLSELCAFVASLRPGFASLLNSFIKREDYSTGVKELDVLLDDSFHYMIYQESVMKVLSWLGIKESETYDIIKKIAKKKFKPEQLEELQKTLRGKWKEHIGNDDKFDEIWETIDNFAKYGFNASHSFSVSIDCLYGAYLKANYPLEYYTVCLNNYYEDIDKTTKITKELEYFNITVLPPKFRYSKAEYMFDKETKSIYKGVASIKFLNETVANQLYELRDKHFNTFTEMIRCIMFETSINFKQLKILTKLNYFSEFGKNKKLLAIIDNYEKRLKNKSLKEKTVETRMNELMECEREIEDKTLDIKAQIEAEIEYLGNPMITKSTLPDNIYGVVEIKNQYLKLYQINSGITFDYRMKKSDMNKNQPFGIYNIIKVNGIKIS